MSCEPENQAASESVNQPKRRSYDVGFKLSVVAFAEQTSNRAAGRKHGIDEKRIREWRSLKATFEQNPRSKRKRLSGGGRKPLLSKQTELRLADWIGGLLAEKQRVEHSSIVAESRKLALEENRQSTFIASKSWLHNFFRRHGFVSEKNIVVGKEDEANKSPVPPYPSFAEIVTQIRELQGAEKFAFRTMGGVEEVVMCVQTRGKQVTNENYISRICNSACITVALGAAADGRKYLPFAVFREGDVVSSTGSNCHIPVSVNYSSDGQMTDTLLSDWLNNLWWSGHMDRRGILVWDSSTSQHVSNTRRLTKEQGTELFFLSHRLVSNLHPSLPSWGEVFKDNFDKLHFSNMDHQQDGFTLEQVLEWISQAWQVISQELILECLQARGIILDKSDQYRESNCAVGNLETRPSDRGNSSTTALLGGVRVFNEESGREDSEHETTVRGSTMHHEEEEETTSYKETEALVCDTTLQTNSHNHGNSGTNSEQQGDEAIVHHLQQSVHS